MLYYYCIFFVFFLLECNSFFISNRNLIKNKNKFIYSKRNSFYLTTSSTSSCSTSCSSFSLSSSLSPSTSETFSFESNVGGLMDILIHSIYMNKDVFLRELVSNAIDACKKNQMNFFQNQKERKEDKDQISLSISPSPSQIKVSTHKRDRLLMIEDNGIGMNKQDLITNLGRIAESGTLKYHNKEKENENNLIGQFGVGFYSAFLVANHVEVYTRTYQDYLDGKNAWKWSANRQNLTSYDIQEVKLSKNPLEIGNLTDISIDNTTFSLTDSFYGTKIVLKMSEDNEKYFDFKKLRSIIENYIEYIEIPIQILNEESKNYVIINSLGPLWLRSPKNCTQENYLQFYHQTFNKENYFKFLSNFTENLDSFSRSSYSNYFNTSGTSLHSEDPFGYLHFSVDGSINFSTLLYIPAKLSQKQEEDMFFYNNNIKLYHKNVLLNYCDKNEEVEVKSSSTPSITTLFFPRWLNFLQGIINCNSILLTLNRNDINVERNFYLINAIKKKIINKIIVYFYQLLVRNKKKYNEFWKIYGRYIKVGIIEDQENREDLIPLAQFHSSKFLVNQINDMKNQETEKNEETLTSLSDYVKRMKKNQKKIFYYVTNSLISSVSSPIIKNFIENDYEILILPDAMSEMALKSISNYQSYPLVDVGRESINDLDGNNLENDENNLTKEKIDILLDFNTYISNNISNKIIIKPSKRLQSKDSLSIFLPGPSAPSPHILSFLRLQGMLQQAQEGVQTKTEDYSTSDQSELTSNNKYINRYNSPESLLSILCDSTLELNINHPLISYLIDLKIKNKKKKLEKIYYLIFLSSAQSIGYPIPNPNEFNELLISSLLP